MNDGYYWYIPGENEIHEDLNGKPQIVEIWNNGELLALFGIDYPYKTEEAKGTFEGPIHYQKQLDSKGTLYLATECSNSSDQHKSDLLKPITGKKLD